MINFIHHWTCPKKYYRSTTVKDIQDTEYVFFASFDETEEKRTFLQKHNIFRLQTQTESVHSLFCIIPSPGTAVHNHSTLNCKGLWDTSFQGLS